MPLRLRHLPPHHLGILLERTIFWILAQRQRKIPVGGGQIAVYAMPGRVQRSHRDHRLGVRLIRRRLHHLQAPFAVLGEPAPVNIFLPLRHGVVRFDRGLWPWGAGRITRPKDETVLYIPREPYLPPGTLRDVLAYPSAAASFDAAAYPLALERLALDRLIPLLDESQRWERDLSDAEQDSLAFARTLLHAPAWLIIDQALETLDVLASTPHATGENAFRV